MPRPAFALTEDQAKTLVAAMAELGAQHPDGTARDHRPFVRDFIRAVHGATGKTYSPAIYRRLLSAYAPTRRPSTTTLAQEKHAFDQSLDQHARAGRQLPEHSAHDLAQVIERAVAQALARTRPNPPSAPLIDSRLAEAQRDFLQERLADTEAQLAQARAHAARLAADLQAAQAVRQTVQAQLDHAQAALQQQGSRVAELANAVESVRAFAMRAIDQVRGETRAWQERCAQLDAELHKAKQHAEYFRQSAYQRGAAIPPDLRQEPRK